ncbi:tyrosine-type recombinase/integrase [Priestia megaterium]|jgi:integrase|uniref:tyrosine-type recombinase/integrase n=1 Tax=Priestia megaterium TaxID=1404 RepID=UPI002452ACCB|nr:site-specific integrase [Priestia megaterium]MDH3142471.1 site-specific integrase [Priestia megaterium]MED4240003.1 site-specific integrase [Priestia megaterium]MED4255199.1 site-specific integrase [Priestia megaterium]MED4265454.1 site-specific integrase [Priestia megaterium]MED4274778.1 site-specific integrase [Priestia megaterium]
MLFSFFCLGKGVTFVLGCCNFCYGQPINSATLAKIFNRIIKKSGVPKLRFHDLRHTHATLLLEAGVSLKEVQERLGHSSIKMTGDIYAHVTNKMKNNASKKFSEYMQEHS